MSLDVAIASIEKNSREEIRVALKEFKGVRFCDVRVFTEYSGPGHNMGPTKAGVAVAFDKLPDLISALSDAHQKAQELGLADGGGA